MASTLTVPYGYIRGRFLYVVGDTAGDADRMPDALPAVGTVTFTPVTPIRVVDAPAPLTAIARAVVTTINADGELVDPAGAVGVWLVEGQYDVAFAFTGVTHPGFRIEVTTAHTLAAPLDLTLAAPLKPSPATVFVVNEQVARDAEAARVEAVAAAEAADADRVNAQAHMASAWNARNEAVGAADIARNSSGEALQYATEAKQAAALVPWYGTRAEYDALATKDATRLYIIRAA